MERTQFLIVAALLCALSPLVASQKAHAYGSEQQEWLSLLDQCDKVLGNKHPAAQKAFDYVRRRIARGKVSDLHRFVSKSTLMSQCRRHVEESQRAEKVQRFSGSLDFAAYARPTPFSKAPALPAEPEDPLDLSSRRFFDGSGRFPGSRIGLAKWVTQNTSEVRIPTVKEIIKGAPVPDVTDKFLADDPLKFDYQFLSIAPVPSPSLFARKSIDAFAIGKVARMYKAPYDIVRTIVEVALMHNISPALVLAMTVAESHFNPTIVSPKNAHGLMQLLPVTAKEMGIDPSLLHIPRFNVTAGVRYIKKQLETFKNLALALAAYNAGPTRVHAAKGIPKIEETRLYVPKILKHIVLINEALSLS
ncbi:MAG: lytic transglycosylase domain-containing protein [Elusimicrobia bacterium]|nr:lytic transglycosylase domain-containing protein [Elusimicrobiota bacterium]